MQALEREQDKALVMPFRALLDVFHDDSCHLADGNAIESCSFRKSYPDVMATMTPDRSVRSDGNVSTT
jgi:hypothetical protein